MWLPFLFVAAIVFVGVGGFAFSLCRAAGQADRAAGRNE